MPDVLELFDQKTTLAYARERKSQAKLGPVLFPYKKIDELYNKGANVLDLTKREAIYKELDDLLMSTCTYLPVFYKQVPYAWNKDLKATTNSNVYIIYDWSWNK
jgi:ABC-type transport system substrate-binding protein